MDKNTGSAPMPSGMHDLDGEEISTTVTENKQQLQPEWKEHFEQNMLDGDKVDDCGATMLSAESVWDYLQEALSQDKQQFIKALEGLRKELIIEDDGFMDDTDILFNAGFIEGYGKALDDVLKLSK